MSIATKPEVAETLEQAEGELLALMAASESEISAVAQGFEDLAHDTDTILRLAGGIVGCVEDEKVLSVLPKVKTLGETAKLFIRERLEATSGILETVTEEAKLLERLSHLTRGQRAIARETQTLSVLTNIEVARLGELGAGFQYLAHELDSFSQSVVTSIKDLTSHTEERKRSVEETKRMLATGLPRIQQEFARIEGDLENALAVVDSSQEQLARAPMQFRGCVEEIAGQIAGVVSAVQGHDITRQQLEHVNEALHWMTEKIGDVEEDPQELPETPDIAAGLLIQIYQLRSIQETVGHWLMQIRQCMDGILRISSSELVGIGPLVLEQERELSAQLVRIEGIERECETDNAEVQATFAGLSSLMQLVGEHLEKSRYVRDRLQLLTFNSIIEASRLGSQADAILEISQSIKRISTSWSEMTDRSAQSMDEILKLVGQAKAGMQSFSEGGKEGLGAARAETSAGLENLRQAAQFAAGQAAEVEAATGRLQSRLAKVGDARDRLDTCFAQIGAVLSKVEQIQRQWEADCPRALDRCDRQKAEALFSATYTTEVERHLLRAALFGTPIPTVEENLAGNDVELF
jgi:chromosome segregation ATPase